MGKGLTLFVFEGPQAENVVAKSLMREFMGMRMPPVCTFDTVIYALYKDLLADPYMDLVEVLRSVNAKNAEVLKGLTHRDFAYIYMFFDYDGHASNASDDVVADMLKFFNEETEYGKLYISYPMVEALRHYPDSATFRDLTVKCKRGRCGQHKSCADAKECAKEKHYKKVVPQECRRNLVNWGMYTRNEWRLLIWKHVAKAHRLLGGDGWPGDVIGQEDIFAAQRRNYIGLACPQVAVLSAFPLYALDYYGSRALQARLAQT